MLNMILIPFVNTAPVVKEIFHTYNTLCTFISAKSCYQCAYSPPKTYYDKKVIVESVKYGKHYGSQKKTGYKHDDDHYGREQGGYTKKSYVPVPYTINVSVLHNCIHFIIMSFDFFTKLEVQLKSKFS